MLDFQISGNSSVNITTAISTRAVMITVAGALGLNTIYGISSSSSGDVTAYKTASANENPNVSINGGNNRATISNASSASVRCLIIVLYGSVTM